MSSSPAPLGGSAWENQVIHLARLYRWRVAHFRPAHTAQGSWRTPVSADGAGWPDLTLVRPPELLFVELKADKARLSAEQRTWLEALGQVADAIEEMAREAYPGIEGPRPVVARVEVHVWRPRDFDDVKRRLELQR